MLPSPTVSTIAETIQLSLSPVFMLAGVASLLNTLAGRLSRVVDRARDLERLHPQTTGLEHDRHVTELRLLSKRMTVINAALLLGVISAMLTCSVVAMLFVAELAKLHIGSWLAVVFILAMLTLVASLAFLLAEVRFSVRSIRIRPELLS